MWFLRVWHKKLVWGKPSAQLSLNSSSLSRRNKCGWGQAEKFRSTQVWISFLRNFMNPVWNRDMILSCLTQFEFFVFNNEYYLQCPRKQVGLKWMCSCQAQKIPGVEEIQIMNILSIPDFSLGAFCSGLLFESNKQFLLKTLYLAFINSICGLLMGEAVPWGCWWYETSGYLIFQHLLIELFLIRAPMWETSFFVASLRHGWY